MPVYAYKLKSGKKRYLVSYRLPSGRQTTKRGFTHKKDATDFEAEVTVDKNQGTFVSAGEGRATIATLGADWLVAHEATVKPSTYHSDESAWRIHVKPKWGGRAVATIRHTEVTAWVAELAKIRKATTVTRCHGILAAILDGAVRDQRVAKNVARDVKLPRKGRARKVYLTHEQVETLADETKYPDFVRFLTYTGLRWGEVAGLRVVNVNLDRRRVEIDENAVQINGHFVVGTPKGHQRRSVPYPKFLDLAVRAACEGKQWDELVWPSEDGGHLRQGNSQSGWFAGAVKRCMAGDETFQRVTPHGLRHTSASLAISAGANVKAVQRMLGHKSAAMTLDTYADLFDDDLDTVAGALDKARRKALRRKREPTARDNGMTTEEP